MSMKTKYPAMMLATLGALLGSAACSDGASETQGSGGTGGSGGKAGEDCGLICPPVDDDDGPLTECKPTLTVPTPKPAEMIFLLDRSLTMEKVVTLPGPNNTELQSTLWEQAIHAMVDFASDGPERDLGLLMFPDQLKTTDTPCLEHTQVALPLGTSLSQFGEYVAGLSDPGHMWHPSQPDTNGMTPSLPVIAHAFEMIRAAGRTIDLVYIGDGKHTCGGSGERVDAMLQFMEEEHGFRTHVVGFGAGINIPNLNRHACSGGASTGECKPKMGKEEPLEPLQPLRALPDGVVWESSDGDKTEYPTLQYRAGKFDAGETPFEYGCQDSSGRCFHVADDGASLAKTLQTIMKRPSCTFTVEIPSNASPSTTNPAIRVLVAGQQLEPEVDYVFDPALPELRLLGEHCDAVQTGGTQQLQVEFECQVLK